MFEHSYRVILNHWRLIRLFVVIFGLTQAFFQSSYLSLIANRLYAPEISFFVFVMALFAYALLLVRVVLQRRWRLTAGLHSSFLHIESDRQFITNFLHVSITGLSYSGAYMLGDLYYKVSVENQNSNWIFLENPSLVSQIIFISLVMIFLAVYLWSYDTFTELFLPNVYLENMPHDQNKAHTREKNMLYLVLSFAFFLMILCFLLVHQFFFSSI